MIHSVSRYYNTSERMTSLLLKVTNQMIRTCRSYLSEGVARVWELSRYAAAAAAAAHPFLWDGVKLCVCVRNRPELLRRISSCCLLNAEYQRSFRSVRDTLRGNPTSRPFDFR